MFKLWLENQLSADEVLEIVKKSPNLKFTPEQWRNWIVRWGVEGDFERKQISVLQLLKLIDKMLLRINNSIDSGAVDNKKETGERNIVVITKLPHPLGGIPFQVIDGNHSLVAAIQKVRETGKDEMLDVIVPKGF